MTQNVSHSVHSCSYSAVGLADLYLLSGSSRNNRNSFLLHINQTDLILSN